MAWNNFWKTKQKEEPVEQANPIEVLQPQSGFIGHGRIAYNEILEDVFDGEKNPGELGAVYDTLPDHLRLRLRAYDMNLKTDIIKIITGKFFKWVVGVGLKLQSEPNEVVLGMSGITEDFPKLKKETEALFGLYAKSKYSDYQKKDDLHERASNAFDASFLGGDVLCIIRVDEFGPNMQVIDGQQVSNPFDDKGKTSGNVIKNGIEIDKKGSHIAFWVEQDNDLDTNETNLKTHERIIAVNSNGNLMAWMVYGSKARIDHHRGIPVISSILEKVSKLDRYVEASVTKAEQTANVVYAFKHNTNSTGENILTTSLTSVKSNDETDETIFEKNGRTAAMLRQSTSGVVMNLTPDSDLINLSSENETTFPEFFRAIFVALCAAVDIPEEVALQKYEQNYSSSRAAINGWEHILEIYRNKFSKKFYEPFYKVWLEHQILKGKLNSNGFLKSKINGDFMALEAYYNSKFTGKKMPHIDPLKEAKAVRTMLGDDTTPLISREQAAEAMGAGDWASNYSKSKEEQKEIPEPKIEENVKK